ncbi:MAG: ABC transporter permease [Acidobacteria bacterium]|nr:ABC transporter permease [Acidobacteriota bacterium]
MNPLPRLFGRSRRYNDIDVSIEEHIQERADELEAEGMPRKQAEQSARREFGNVGLLQQRSREQWQWPALESLLADLKFTFRRLRKSPGFAITVLLTLAIGIGANTAVFSVINGVLLKPLPYPDSNQLVALWLNAPGASGLANFESGLRLSESMFFTFSEHNHSFQSLGVWVENRANVTGIAQPEEVHTILVSKGLLETLNIPPTLGRWLSAADQDPHGAKRVMLSYGYWQRRFGGDKGVVGRSLQLDSQTREIVGVMPRGFRVVDNDFDLLVPLQFDRSKAILAGFGYNGIARLKPGISISQANADVSRLVETWMSSFSNGPGTNPFYYRVWKISPDFRSLKQQVIGSVTGVLWVVMATVGLVMLIACVNIANLLLVRADSRQNELAVRAALGAGRGRIVRELLIESVTLGMVGGLFALGVAFGGLKLLVAHGPANLPRLSEVALDAGSLTFALILSILSGLFFGSIPALKYSTTRAIAALSGSNRTASDSRSRNRSRNVLVVAQVAMALVLLVSALLMIRTFTALRNVDPGFDDPAHTETVRIYVPDLLISNQTRVTQTLNELSDKIAALPGVQSAAFAGAAPMEGIDPNWDEMAAEGKVYPGGEPPLRLFNYVSPGYFKTMGTKIVAGREYTWDDDYGLRNNIIVSENFARENWGSSQAAVGKRIRQFSNMPWQIIIGVAQDVRHNGVDEKAPEIVYWPAIYNSPYTRTPTIDGLRAVTFVVRSHRAGSEALIADIQRVVWSINANLPVATPGTMQDIYAKSMARTSFTLTMLAIAGSMALLLGIIGIYGVISYAVSQRTREIGIRLALGAQKSELKWMFVRSALSLTVAGVAIGLVSAAAVTQSLKSLLFGISPIDPLTYLTVPLVLCAAAALASYLPARRAASVNPVHALRVD